MTRPRIAIYARHSTDKQNPLSSADQAAACEVLVERLGGELVGTYTDPEISGYRRDRPGLLRMLQEARDGRLDVIVCEALDRIARDGEDISWLGKKLRYDRVRLVTSTEGEIDEVKLAVAGLLGSMFLSNLRHKTFRGMKAAVLAGRLVGGRAYGYRREAPSPDGGPGAMTINHHEAEVVRRIFRDFAAGQSSVRIATALNTEGVAGPRGGPWNASTIRGDPKKLVGILNNPLYTGKLVWGRREWRKDPDSDKRERRYRLRDRTEWIEVAMPDLAIIDQALAGDVQRELARRSRPAGGPPGNGKRERHLLSGLIKCGSCGSNYTIAGKDYYRCAGAKERGTCSSRTSVRVAPLEQGVLAALQTELLTADVAEIFVAEFQREVARLERIGTDRGQAERDRLAAVEAELASLSKNLLAGVVGPTIVAMIAEREAEREELRQRSEAMARSRKADVLPHPALLKRYEEKISRLREALADKSVREEAITTVRGLIESVTIHADASGSVLADVAAPAGALLGFAQNAENPRRYRDRGCSVAMVAGTRNSRCLHKRFPSCRQLIERTLPRISPSYRPHRLDRASGDRKIPRHRR